MERKAFKAELKANVDKREIEGYAAIFGNLDSHKDVTLKGAFEETIRQDFSPPGSGGRNRVKMLWQHIPHEPIGRPLDLSEDSKGLHFRARLSKGVRRADEALILIDDEVIDEMSFGYDTIESEMGEHRKDDGSAVRARFLKSLKLWEISPVTWGSNDTTTVAAAKRLADIAANLEAGQALPSKDFKLLMSELKEQEAALDRLLNLLEAANVSEGDDGTKGAEETNEGAEVASAFVEFKEWIKGVKG